MLVPLGKNEFRNFDDKDSFKLRVNRAEFAMDSRDLANVLNSYVFRRPDSPLKQPSISVEKGQLLSNRSCRLRIFKKRWSLYEWKARKLFRFLGAPMPRR